MTIVRLCLLSAREFRHSHSKQLYGHWVEISTHRALYQRSIFAMVDVYNNLSQETIDSISVQVFQSSLTKIARSRCEDGVEGWSSPYCAR